MRLMAIAAALAMVSAFSYGDTVYLENGDKISGTLKSIQGDVLVIDTDYAGTLSIAQDKVKSFSTERDVEAELADGTRLNGAAATSEDVDAVRMPGLADGDIVDVSQIAMLADDIDALVEKSKPKVWSGTADLGVTVQSGTTDSTDMSAKVTLVRQKARHSFTITGSALYGEVDDEINTRRYFGQLRWQFYPRDRWYTYALTNLEHDGGKKLDLRWGAGLGVGYDIIVNDTRKWSLEAGLDYRKEWWDTYSVTSRPRAQRNFRNDLLADTRDVLRRFRNTPTFNSTIRSQISDLAQRAYFGLEEETEIEEDISLRIASHYEQDVLEKSRIIWDLTLRPETDEFGEYRAVSDLTWSTPLSETLALRLNWLSEYDSNPGQNGVERWDNKFITALGYKF